MLPISVQDPVRVRDAKVLEVQEAMRMMLPDKLHKPVTPVSFLAVRREMNRTYRQTHRSALLRHVSLPIPSAAESSGLRFCSTKTAETRHVQRVLQKLLVIRSDIQIHKERAARVESRDKPANFISLTQRKETFVHKRIQRGLCLRDLHGTEEFQN